MVGAAQQLYAAYPDGRAPVTATQADLLLGDPDSRAAYPGAQVAAIPLSEAELSQAPRSVRQPAGSAGLPSTPPALVGTAGSPIEVCSVFTDTSGSSLAVSIRTLPLNAAQLAATLAATCAHSWSESMRSSGAERTEQCQTGCG